jgi:hypothetical protein
MNTIETDAVLTGAGVAAGIISAVVGNGTLIGFPAMLFCGFSPLTANMTTALGLVPGSLSAAIGMRPELRGQAGRVRQLGALAGAGSLLGAGLLLVLPAAVFAAAIPALIGIAVLAVAGQPWLTRRLAARRADHDLSTISGDRTAAGRDNPPGPGPARRPTSWALPACVAVIGVYTGFFGGGAGLAYYAALAIGLPEPLRRSNAVKVCLVLIANVVASTVFIVGAHGTGAHIAWIPAIALALGSIVGGQIGARIGRVLPETALRGVILAVGVVAFAYSVETAM